MTWGPTGPWTLSVEGWKVLTIVFAFKIHVIADGGREGSCVIGLAGAFELSGPDGPTHRLDAEQQSWEGLTPVLSLRRDTLSTLVVTDDARLVARFDSGRTLSAEADERPYEHWDVTTPEGRLIALPGNAADGVAVFT